MSFSKIRKALSTAVNTGWLAAQPSIPLYFENIRREQPENAQWVLCDIYPNMNMRADLGSNVNMKAFGTMVFNVMTPAMDGTDSALSLIDSLQTILVDKDFSLEGGGKVTTYGMDIRTRGVQNGWHSMVVTFEWRAYYTVAR